LAVEDTTSCGVAVAAWAVSFAVPAAVVETGAQVRALCEIGSLVGRARPEQRAAIGEFGESLGLAYQIMDDVCDLRGVTHRQQVTKRVAEDLCNAKVAFPLARSVTLLPRAEAAALWQSLRADPDERAVQRAARTIEDSGAVRVCEQGATRLLGQPGPALNRIFPTHPVRRPWPRPPRP
jgi:geranylgeranyl pyrophosphate synthase